MDPVSLASLAVTFLKGTAGGAGSEVGKVLGRQVAQAIAPAVTAPAHEQALAAARTGTASPAVTVALEQQVALHARTNPAYARNLEETIVRLRAELAEAQRQLDGTREMREGFARRNQDQREHELMLLRLKQQHELEMARLRTPSQSSGE
jgi:hypothetical protein